jgi:hypothetical protein
MATTGELTSPQLIAARAVRRLILIALGLGERLKRWRRSGGGERLKQG